MHLGIPMLALTLLNPQPVHWLNEGMWMKALPQMAHGVVFFCPAKKEDAVAELRKIKADGYRLIEFASWCWTLPTSGSQLESTATAVLDWCDANEMRFVLMHNIQFGSSGEGGGLDDAAIDPARSAKYLSDWLRVMKGHRSVTAVVLGSEVAPIAGNPNDNPAWWAAFVKAMSAKHGTIGALNAAWSTNFVNFYALQPPKTGSPGEVDLNEFAASVFNRFYGTLFEKSVKPILEVPSRNSHILYGCKMEADPLLQRACESFTMICWDDVLSDYPQWRLKALGDIARRTNKPVFNSELHLYNDSYAYAPSPRKSRYRYLLSALNNEWMTASFAWGQWNKPDIAAIHAATPGILRELIKLEPLLRQFQLASPRVYVLLSPTLSANNARAQRLYARMAGLGTAWEYLCPQDIQTVRNGTIFVPDQTRLTLKSMRDMAVLPSKVKVVFETPSCIMDEYGRAPDDSLMKALTKRAVSHCGISAIPVAASDRLPPPCSELTKVDYLAWSADRGHYSYPLSYPSLEARQVKIGNKRLVAVVNHATTGPIVRACLPWFGKLNGSVTGVTGSGGDFNAAAMFSFAPLDVRIFTYKDDKR